MSDNRSLFEDPRENRPPEPSPDAPLAERMRPLALEDVVGLDNLVSEGKFLRTAIENDRLPSMIFWGPPGSGKTTLARIIERRTKSRFVPFSAVTSGIRDVKAIMVEARRRRRGSGRPTIVFIDEIHRFNRTQQDAFLPYVESGDIVLIGATTENPSFEVNGALLSRCKVIVLPPLDLDQTKAILRRAISDPDLSAHRVEIDASALAMMASTSAGDARQALGNLDIVVATAGDGSTVDAARANEILQRSSLLYDKSGEEHYNLVSALHKSIRNGDPDAAVYWLARMVEGGEDPLYIARRLLRAAAEDVGLADPEALRMAVAAKDAVHFMGMPEGGVVLAEIVVYLAQAPKSNAVYEAMGAASNEVRDGMNPPVPLHLRNATTPLMKEVGYGKGYRYAHDFDDGTAAMSCLPAGLEDRRFYRPKQIGREQEIAERIERYRKARKKMKSERETQDSEPRKE